jgi:transposase-like protein
MTKYSKAFKAKVVREYKRGVRGKGFGALSTRFKISKQLIEKWWRKWNAGGQTMEAFESQAGGDRRSKLTERQKERYILDFVSHKNAKGEAVDYKDIHKNVIKHTKKNVAERTVRKIGKEELDLSWKQTTQTLVSDGTSTVCCLPTLLFNRNGRLP